MGGGDDDAEEEEAHLCADLPAVMAVRLGDGHWVWRRDEGPGMYDRVAAGVREVIMVHIERSRDAGEQLVVFGAERHAARRPG